MTIVPRFVQVGEVVHLMSVRMDGGVMTDIAGPIPMGNAVSKEDLIHTVDQLLGRALHEAPVLQLSDLPEALRNKLQPPQLIESPE